MSVTSLDMSYGYAFFGHFNFDKPLERHHIAYVKKFSNTRRVKRNSKKVKSLPDRKREKVGLPIGKEGGYYVGGSEDVGVLDHNTPPSNQPGLWCDWRVSKHGTRLDCDDADKFYNYSRWLKYLIKHFFAPWGYVLNGKVKVLENDNENLYMREITIRDNCVSIGRRIAEGDD